MALTVAAESAPTRLTRQYTAAVGSGVSPGSGASNSSNGVVGIGPGPGGAGSGNTGAEKGGSGGAGGVASGAATRNGWPQSGHFRSRPRSRSGNASVRPQPAPV